MSTKLSDKKGYYCLNTNVSDQCSENRRFKITVTTEVFCFSLKFFLITICIVLCFADGAS
jgi:hypothetical protein